MFARSPQCLKQVKRGPHRLKGRQTLRVHLPPPPPRGPQTTNSLISAISSPITYTQGIQAGGCLSTFKDFLTLLRHSFLVNPPSTKSSLQKITQKGASEPPGCSKSRTSRIPPTHFCLSNATLHSYPHSALFKGSKIFRTQSYLRAKSFQSFTVSLNFLSPTWSSARVSPTICLLSSFPKPSTMYL